MRCRFKNKIFQNEENGYTIAIFTTRDSSVPLSARDKYLASKNIIGFSAIGFGLPLTEEIELEMEGRWETGDHGTQFQVENFMEVVPRTKEGILGYLSSGAVKGIGPKTADMIYRKFGLQTLEIMENSPKELLKIRGISEKKLSAIVESYGKNRVFRELMTFLAPFKVTPKKVQMILKRFGNESVEIVRYRPYMLSAVRGFGFLTVDAIGKQCCCALNDPMRISGCLSYVLGQALKEGHLFKLQSEVLKEAEEMLNKDLPMPVVSKQDISQVLYRLVLQKSIVLDEERIYVMKQYEEENQTASMIARRLLAKSVPLSIETELEKAQKTLEITLSETQKQAVRMVFEHSISIITGGPGTGKTTVLKVILYIHQALCRTEVQLMAPTGRAARRMMESTGCDNASTMHLALGLLGDDTDFEPDFEYLNAGFLNVDEVSMVDMHLAYEFFRRVNRNARILLVGDKNQLPSVGAGDVFRQLIACGLIPVTVLDLVYRQGAKSNIPYNAKLMQENNTNLVLGEDFQFIACKGADEAAEIVRSIYLDEIARNGMEQVQILTPYRKRSAAGVEELNKSLEDFVNPPTAGKKELHIGSQVFRVGDKILQNKNTETASNGDMGRILDFVTDEDGNAKAVIGFTDGRQVQYEADQMEMIEHANATTIHKAQGSECPVIIIPWVKAFYMMLKRNILYTGVTRAKSKVYLVGEWAAVCQAIHTDDSGTRNTILGERIVQYYYQYQSEQKPEMEQLKLVV
jgi:exodeoxyribonuclease V alpha subunit